MRHPAEPITAEKNGPSPQKEKRKAQRGPRKRKNRMDAPQPNQGALQQVLHAAPCMSVILRRDYTVAYFSPYGQQATGYTAEEVLGKNYFDIFIPDAAVREGIFNDIQKVATGVPTRGYENPVWCKDGSQHWFSWNSEYLPDYEGAAGFLGIGQDVTAYKQAQEALRASNARTRALLQAIPDWMFRFRRDGTFLDFHAQNPEDLLMPAEAIIGGNIFYSPIPKPVVEQIMGAARQALESGQLQTLEYSLHLPSRTGHYEARIGPGGADEVVAIVRDITRRKRIGDELRRMSKVFLDAADPIVLVDMEGRITAVNDEAVRVYGWKREELVGQPIQVLVLPERHPRIGERLEICRQKGTLRNLEGVRRNKAGEPLPVLMTYSLLTNETGEPVGIATIAKDISELKHTQEQLRQLSARLITSQEEASRQIARELHDVFSQRLAVLGMEMSALEQQVPSPAGPAAANLRRLGEEIGRLAKDVHQLSRQLHPSVLHDLGLTVALRSECDSFGRQHGIAIQFLPQYSPEALPPDVALCLYRVAQESLRNIVLHAQATGARVTLAGDGNEVTLTIEDCGSGFDPEQVKAKGGLGLTSMEERVRLANGTISILSQPGSGTRVQVRVPLPRA
ncbi:MAG: PAS domain S-box protein [Acidobacteria bacterium]|nr:PAS domain S-box protein [Acidobacteriota bacterium]